MATLVGDPLLDCMLATRATLRPRVEAVAGAKLYVGQREEFNADGSVKALVFPHVWMRYSQLGPGAPTLGRPLGQIFVDAYGRSLGELATLMNAINTSLDGKQFPTYNTAINPRYSDPQSDTYLQEAPDRHHRTVLYGVSFGDGRKLIP